MGINILGIVGNNIIGITIIGIMGVNIMEIIIKLPLRSLLPPFAFIRILITASGFHQQY